MTRRIALATAARSDYSPLYWVLAGLHHLGADFGLIVGGAHLQAEHGHTADEIRADGWPIWAEVATPAGSDPGSLATADARVLSGFAAALLAHRADLVVLLGDRHEMLAVALAATLCRLPIAHIGGGDVTAGAWDDGVRHALTKLAHWHFVGNATAARRVRQLGESAARIVVSGDPALDHFRHGTAASIADLTAICGFRPDRQTLVVTYHPPTAQLERLPAELAAIVATLRAHAGGVVLTGPAPEPQHEVIRAAWRQLAAERPQTVFVESLGGYRYRGLLQLAGALLGNSSSGVIEAGVVPIPAVNVGDRQAGRVRGGNVLEAAGTPDGVAAAVRQALAPAFRAGLARGDQPYGDGDAGRRIAQHLMTLPDTATLLAKPFIDQPDAVRSQG